MMQFLLLSQKSALIGCGLMLLVCLGFISTATAQSDNLTNAPVGKQWIEANTAKGIVNTQLTAVNLQLTNLYNQGSQGVELELAKARVQFYTDMASGLTSGLPVHESFSIAFANMEAIFLGDYLDVKVLSDSHLIEIKEDARAKLTI